MTKFFNIKKNFVYIVLILFAIIISCKSPTEPIQPGQPVKTVPHDPPIITITGNSAYLFVGDTLTLTIHAADSTLKSGTLDFLDSTIIVFNNLKPVLDTTIIHIFKIAGSFKVKASFSNDDTIATAYYQVKISNTWPVVTLSPNKTTITLGDTLKITLHASDAKLTAGTLDFKDGTILTFSNLYRSVDTTINHVYSQLGTFSVTAVFNNGINSTSQSVSVSVQPVQHYYAFSFQIGMTWRFSYDYEYSNYVTEGDSSQIGVHTWKIVSSQVTDSDTTFTIMQTINDVIHYIYYPYTSYTIKDTSYFTFTYSYSRVLWKWPTKLNGYEIFSIPNHALISISSYPFYFFDDNGPNNNYYSYSIAYISVSERFTLIDFTKP